jgi:hypothetical protein
MSTQGCSVLSFGHADLVRCVAWSLDGKQFLSGSDDETVRLWNVATGGCLRVIDGHTSRVSTVAWSASGEQLLSGSTTFRCGTPPLGSSCGYLMGTLLGSVARRGRRTADTFCPGPMTRHCGCGTWSRENAFAHLRGTLLGSIV